MFFKYSQLSCEIDIKFEVHWQRDFSGDIVGASPVDVLYKVNKDAPNWLKKWILSRKKPIWFGYIGNFIPFSGRILVRSQLNPSMRPLEDFVIIPFGMSKVERHLVVVGFHRRLKYESAKELASLLKIYVSCAVSEMSCDVPELTLTKVQLDCLRWMAAGKTLEEISIITGMSYSNVRYHLEKAKRNSGHKSMQQLLIHASRLYKFHPSRVPE